MLDNDRLGRGSTLAAAGVMVLLAAALFIGGREVGVSDGTDMEAARSEGRNIGAERGREAGQRAGFEAGLARGRRVGYRSVYRRARARWYRRGVKSVEQLGPVASTGQPASCAPGLVSGANGCVPESQAQCAAYQDFVPGQGCVPPLAPGEVEATPHCPPGQVPVGITGACARP
jgi:hypothetical protein